MRQPLCVGTKLPYIERADSAPDDAGRPVLVWIHGGGYRTGQGAVPWYNGTRFAANGDIVTVTINCRVGALGYASVALRRRVRHGRLERHPRSDHRLGVGAPQHRRVWGDAAKVTIANQPAFLAAARKPAAHCLRASGPSAPIPSAGCRGLPNGGRTDGLGRLAWRPRARAGGDGASRGALSRMLEDRHHLRAARHGLRWRVGGESALLRHAQAPMRQAGFPHCNANVAG